MKTFKFGDSKIYLHNNDLPQNIEKPKSIAIDTETTGLSLKRDRLCLAQFAFPNKECHLVKFDKDFNHNECKKLVEILSDKSIVKVFHYARFDVAMLNKFLDIKVTNIFCTKIASKLVRTYTDKHGLKDLCKELINVDLNKSQQSSDWSAKNLTDNQIKYASYDVIFLLKLKIRLEQMLERENRAHIAKSAFEFLPTRIELDFLDWQDIDIFTH
tara:strand:- start:1846 stop:2487 length:642 start_codon:yes stop_codon:yes gene_type:complete